MKRLLTILILFALTVPAFSQSSPGNDTTKYVWYKYSYGTGQPRFEADSVLNIPNDTTYSKTGIARKDSVLYVGNGVYWRAAQGFLNQSDSSIYSIVQDGSVYCFFNSAELSTCWDLGKYIDSISLNYDSTYQVFWNNGVKKPDSLWLPHDDIYGIGRIRISTLPSVLNPGRDSIPISWDSTGIESIQNGLVSGGIVTWSGVGLTYDVTPAIYYINGIRYTSDAGQITLSAADGTNPRHDAITLDTSRAIIKITGTPAADPFDPQYDPNSQLPPLTIVDVQANATTPTGILSTTVYDEDLDWSHTATLTPNFNYTGNPFHLTKSIDIAAWVTTPTSAISFVSPVKLNISDYNVLKFFIDLKAILPAAAHIFIALFNGATTVTPYTDITTVFGLNRTSTDYQNISVPFSSLAITGTQFDKVQFYLYGPGPGMYLDYVQFQGGIGNGNSNFISDIFRQGTTDSIKYMKNGLPFFAHLDGNLQQVTTAGNVTTKSVYIDSVVGTSDASIRNLKIGRGSTTRGGDSLNVIVGRYALQANTTGYWNMAIGDSALKANTTGKTNTAIGFKALDNSTTASGNTAIGLFALEATTTANNNTAIGDHALYQNTTGTNNAALGAFALQSNTTGGSNMGIGVLALSANTTGSNNVAIGTAAGHITTGGSNIAIGQSALSANITSSQNIAIGTSALQTNLGQANVAVGYQSALGLTGATGYSNTATGSRALTGLSHGIRNTAFGDSALLTTTIGSYNIGIGYNALASSLSTSNAIAIGANSIATSNQLSITDSITAMKFKNLDSAAGVAPSVIGKDGGGAWHVYATPSGGGGGTGTVTSVATGLGLTGGPITTSGTAAVDTASSVILSRQRAAATYATVANVSANAKTVSEIATMGNSITAAGLYQAKLLQLINDPTWIINNYGISGDATTEMLPRFPAVAKGNPEYAIVLGGINDVIRDYTAASIEANLQAMYTAAHDSGSRVIALTITPFKGSANWTSGRQIVLDAVNTWITTTATNVNFVVDTYTALEDPVTPDQLLPAYDGGDHLHPSTAGYDAMGQTIFSGVGTFSRSAPASTISATHNITLNQSLTTNSDPAFRSLFLRYLDSILIGGNRGLTTGIYQNYYIPSSVTPTYRVYASAVSTSASLTDLIHYSALPGVVTGTLTNQTGFNVESTMTGATVNMGFRGQLSAATGRYNIFMDGTAKNYMGGQLGLGITTPSTGSILEVHENTVRTAMTGTGFGPAVISNEASIGNYSILDFKSTVGNAGAIGRIGALYGASGSQIDFGVTNNYSSGITHVPLRLGIAGNVYLPDSATSKLIIGTGLTSPSARVNLPIGTTIANGIGWGDVGLFRSAAATIKTDGKLEVAGTSLFTGAATFSAFPILPLTAGSIPYTGVGGAITQNNNTLFFNNTSGFIGIGTNSPQEVFHGLKEASTGTYLRLDGYSGGVPGIQTYKINGTVASPSATASGEFIGLWSMRGYTNAITSAAAAYIGGKATQLWASGASGTQLVFATTPNSSVTAGIALTLDQDKSATFTGDVLISTVGKKLKITEGSNGSLGQTTLVAGTKAITISGLTTSSRAIVTFVSVGGTVTTTWQYAAVCTSNTLTITALTNAGATNTSDTSILNYFIIN